MLLEALESSNQINRLLLGQKLLLPHDLLAIEDDVLLLLVASFHLGLVLLSGVTDSLIEVVPDVIELRQQLHALGILVLLEDVLQHPVSAINLGID